MWCLIEKFVLSFSKYLWLKSLYLLFCVERRRSDRDLLFFVIYLLLKCLSICVPLYFLRVRLSICEHYSLFNKLHLFLMMKRWSKWTCQEVLIVRYFLPSHSRIRINRSLYFSTLYICDYMSNILCTMLWREDRSEHRLIGTKVLH